MALLDTYLGVGAASGIAGMLGGAINTGLQFANRKDMLDLQHEAWNREDTAVQRRAADMEAAGFSKTLAAGNAASTMAPIRLEAPQISKELTDAPMRALQASQGVLELMKQKADISNTMAQAKLIEAQTDKARSEADWMKSANPVKLENLNFENYKLKNTVDDVIKGVKADVQIKGFEQSMQEMDKRLKENNVYESDWQRMMSVIRQETIFQDYDIRTQELIAKKLAIELQKTQNADAARNLQIYKESGLPSNMAPSMWSSGIQGAQALKSLGEGLKQIFGGK